MPQSALCISGVLPPFSKSFSPQPLEPKTDLFLLFSSSKSFTLSISSTQSVFPSGMACCLTSSRCTPRFPTRMRASLTAAPGPHACFAQLLKLQSRHPRRTHRAILTCCFCLSFHRLSTPARQGLDSLPRHNPRCKPRTRPGA